VIREPAPDDSKPATDVTVVRVCPTCRQHFSGDARFCPFDGDPLEAAEHSLADEGDPMACDDLGSAVRPAGVPQGAAGAAMIGVAADVVVFAVLGAYLLRERAFGRNAGAHASGRVARSGSSRVIGEGTDIVNPWSN
jgi:hypothetical protein